MDVSICETEVGRIYSLPLKLMAAGAPNQFGIHARISQEHRVQAPRTAYT